MPDYIQDPNDSKKQVPGPKTDQHYESFDVLAAGQYHLNPIAVSGSADDVAKIKFIYKGGLDGSGRP